MRGFWFTLPFLAILCCGCASFQFEIKEPPVPQPLVTADHETDLAIDPLQYRLITDSGHLVMFIDNPAAQPIDLLGEKCAIVDPDGDTHPLQNDTIQAGSSIKEIFPPLADQSESPSSNWLTNPSSTNVGPTDASGYIRPQGYSNQPADAGPNQAAYHWSWNGESDVQVTLAYSQNGKEFEHHFLFHRVKK
jgi:hypothetical protein